MMPTPTEAEVRQIIRDMPDDRLMLNYDKAAEQPGTEWHRLLLTEMNRRSLPVGDSPAADRDAQWPPRGRQPHGPRAVDPTQP